MWENEEVAICMSFTSMSYDVQVLLGPGRAWPEKASILRSVECSCGKCFDESICQKIEVAVGDTGELFKHFWRWARYMWMGAWASKVVI